MKDFTTPEYITPVIEEIKEKYFLVDPDQTVKKCLNCVGLLHRKATNEYIALRTGGPFFIWQHITTIKKLYKDLETWTKAAEAYTGELDTWRDREEDAIQHAIRNQLINELNNI